MTFLQEAAVSLSSARLRGYRASTEEPNEAVLGRYLWNVALAESILILAWLLGAPLLLIVLLFLLGIGR